MKQRLWRWILRGRFLLFQRHRHRKLVIEQVLSTPFVVLPDVFNPGIFQTGAFLAQQLPHYLTAESVVLDMGTGSGIGAVFAAKISNQVTAADINPEAVRCVQINALLNKVEICAYQSDLFAALPPQKYDVILFNPPFFRGKAQDAYDHAWRSEDTVERFAAQCGDYLTPEGFVLMVLSTNGDEATFLNAFTQVNVIACQDLISEVVTVYQLRP